MCLRNSCIITFLLITKSCFSQDDIDPAIPGISKITFLNPGFSYEMKTGKSQSLYAQVFMNTSFYYSYSSSFGSSHSLYFDPAMYIQYRFYYNEKQRKAKGRRTAMNSLNYFTPLYESIFSKRRLASSYIDEKNRRLINILGAAWGFQRNYRGRFSLDLYLGLGCQFARSTAPRDNDYYTFHDNLVTSVGQINLGFWLNRRK